MATRRVHSVRLELIRKSREAALSAIQTYNNPLIQFKTEAFIVLMVIAWTYMLHAYYRQCGVDYRYCDTRGRRRRYHKTKHGAFKHWELETCLNHQSSPIDKDTKNNLLFLIQLRHEIEHQMTTNLDAYLSARYQACAVNYAAYIKKLFGDNEGIDEYITHSIQLLDFDHDQVNMVRSGEVISKPLRMFVDSFDESLSEDELRSPQFAYRMLFTKTTVNRPGQADSVIEWVSPDSDLALAIEKNRWVRKETERKKYLPKQIVEMMQSDGFSRFNMHQHTLLWKECDGKNTGKGYGTEVVGKWYWYERWITVVREHCMNNRDRYC